MLPEKLVLAANPILEARSTTMQKLIRKQLEDLVQERAERLEMAKTRGAA